MELDGYMVGVRDAVFQKGTSKRIWGELYKVLDSSDVVVQVGGCGRCATHFRLLSLASLTFLYECEAFDCNPWRASAQGPAASWWVSVLLTQQHTLLLNGAPALYEQPVGAHSTSNTIDQLCTAVAGPAPCPLGGA